MDLALTPEQEAARELGCFALTEPGSGRWDLIARDEGTSQIQHLLIGRALTGVSAF